MTKTKIKSQQKGVNSNSLSVYRQPQIFLTLIFTVCIVAAAVVFFMVSLGKSSIGVDLVLDKGQWRVINIDSSGMAYQSGIREGDRPVEINGYPAEIFLEKHEETGHVFDMLIQELSVFDDTGQIKSVKLSDSVISRSALLVQIPIFFVCLIFWVTGFYAFLKRPQLMATRLLCYCSAGIGLLLCANMAAQRGISTALFFEIAAGIVGPWLLLHFFLVLPEERIRIRENPLVYIIYLPAAVTLILFPFIGCADGQPVPEYRNFRFIEAGVALMLVVLVVFLNYFKAASFRTRQQMKIVLIGCLAALIPFLLVYLLPQVIWKQNVIPPGFSILFLGFIPVGMGYAVITQKLLDIDIIIRRGLVYGLITIVMAIILAASIFPVISIQHEVGTPEQMLLALLLGGIATALFGPAKKGIESLVDKFFYKDRYDYRQIIQNMSISLSSLKDINEIARLLVGTVMQSLNLAGGCLFVKLQSGLFEVRAAQGRMTDCQKHLKLLNYYLTHSESRYEFPNSASAINPELAFIMPLVAGEQRVGVLLLSPKVSRQDFSNDDIFLLQGLGMVTAVALRNAMLVKDVSLRDTFISIASHELRTPLTAIMGFGDLLMKRDFPEANRKKWMGYILENGQRLTDLVNELLNVSRIQSGKVNLNLEGVDLAEVIEEQITIVPEKSEKHEFVVDIEPDLPDALADRDKIAQVIGNLLSNAVKYSPKGGKITVTARAIWEKYRIVISIADQGIGIQEKDQKSLFKTFYRIQRPETQGIRGSGLGLYIAKEWIAAMNGEIWLESKENQGSTFFIGVPIKTPDTDEKYSVN